MLEMTTLDGNCVGNTEGAAACGTCVKRLKRGHDTMLCWLSSTSRGCWARLQGTSWAAKVGVGLLILMCFTLGQTKPTWRRNLACHDKKVWDTDITRKYKRRCECSDCDPYRYTRFEIKTPKANQTLCDALKRELISKIAYHRDIEVNYAADIITFEIPTSEFGKANSILSGHGITNDRIRKIVMIDRKRQPKKSKRNTQKRKRGNCGFKCGFSFVDLFSFTIGGFKWSPVDCVCQIVKEVKADEECKCDLCGTLGVSCPSDCCVDNDHDNIDESSFCSRTKARPEEWQLFEIGLFGVSFGWSPIGCAYDICNTVTSAFCDDPDDDWFNVFCRKYDVAYKAETKAADGKKTSTNTGETGKNAESETGTNAAKEETNTIRETSTE